MDNMNGLCSWTWRPLPPGLRLERGLPKANICAIIAFQMTGALVDSYPTIIRAQKRSWAMLAAI